MPSTLEAHYSEHMGKVSDKWSSYLAEYDRILAPYRGAAVHLLEIGVQNGGSLELWAAYFLHAERIIGCDINPECERLSYDDPRIIVIVGEANDDTTQQRIVQEARQFDIIIDDGSHRSGDIVKSFARYFPLLSDGGVFIIEDLHCSYWKEFEGGLFDPYSSMTFLKRLADVVNHEHWGVPKFRSELLRGILTHYDAQLHEQDLGRIHSIEFSNSMCVIRKASTDANALGTRLIVGTDESVVEGVHNLQAMSRPCAPDETENPWSSAVLPPEEEVEALRAELAPLAGRLERLEAFEAEVSAREIAISTLQQRSITSMRRTSSPEKDAVALARERSTWERALSERERQLASLSSELVSLVTARDKDNRIARREHDAIQRRLQKVEAELANARSELKKMKGTVSWRLTKPFRKISISMKKLALPSGYNLASRRAGKVLREKGFLGAFDMLTGRGSLASAPSAVVSKITARSEDAHGFMEWLRRYDTLDGESQAALAARAQAFTHKPLVSVVVPTYNANLVWLAEAIDSVRRQIYPHWELCIVDDASTDPGVRELLQRAAEEDPRVRVAFREENGHISLATNTGFDMAKGEWIALLDHDDVLREHALYWIVEAINRVRDVSLIYSDEDKLEGNRRRDPYFKCDWNRDLFLSNNYICHLSVFQTALIREIGGCRVGFEGAQDFDLVLRYIERIEPTQIHHVPRVLYSWRVHSASTASAGDAKPYAALAGKRALDEHFARTGTDAVAELEPSVSYRARYRMPDIEPLVSIIIPTRNAEALVRQCVDSIVRRTSYMNYEILLVDNGSDDPSALKYFAELSQEGIVRLIRDDRPFNYSALNNDAVRLAAGEFVCLLNNDIEVITAGWLTELVSIGLQPGVGAVGARLWYPNDTLQHGGVIVGLGGVAAHSHRGLPKTSRGYYARAALMQSFSAVTGACLLVKKDLYEKVGGLNEVDLKIAYNDVDFCLRLCEAGLRNVWTPYAELYHHESATRGQEDTPAKADRFEREKRYFVTRWSEAIRHDPAYNPNLTTAREDFSWAWPPR